MRKIPDDPMVQLQGDMQTLQADMRNLLAVVVRGFDRIEAKLSMKYVFPHLKSLTSRVLVTNRDK